MSAGTRIEWADHTFNPWWGCTKVSPGCDNCYAETLSQRFGDDVWGHGKQRKIASETTWKQPYSWDRQASKAGTRARVFCASMSDVLEGGDALDAARRRLWALIEDTPNLDWMLLTKRPHRIKRDIPWTTNWPDNVWMGVSVEDQEWADKRIPHLADCGAQVKFLSAEPLLEELDIGNYSFDIHWVIAGGESGPMARHSLPSNFARLRDQCARFGIPFLFKQWGEVGAFGARRHNRRHQSRQEKGGPPAGRVGAQRISGVEGFMSNVTSIDLGQRIQTLASALDSVSLRCAHREQMIMHLCEAANQLTLAVASSIESVAEEEDVPDA